MKNLAAVFFDFDGVLVDSTAIKVEGFRQLFREVAAEQLEQILDYHRRHGGISRVEKIRYAYREVLQQPLCEKELDVLARRYSDLVVEQVVACGPIKGAEKLLEILAGNCLLFCISGTPEAELKTIVERRGLARFFAEVLGSPVRKPDHIIRLYDVYRLDPAACVFIGDSLTDYFAAEETGMHFIGIQGVNRFPRGTTVLTDCTGVVEHLRRGLGFRV